ncbi:thioredoxin family protein [Lignipirellula cremea]|uniref:Thiol:disulfide interchange protein n=1 Tax=Lignipirellula cremea TaxID=2528010 RepID=A0A518E2H4_9BACT|nr:thioredoxin family protein [Lignipirellula cremea]QDU98289.1 thiol:disulfide interchange protein precursor [Lignipirellula cremea]
MVILRPLMLALALAILVTSSAQAADPAGDPLPAANWHSDVDAAFRLSKATGRPLVLFFTADKCSYCMLMKRQTLTNPQVQTALERSFVPVYVHVGKNELLTEKLGIRSFPTTLIVSPQAKIQDVINGYLAPKDFQHRLATSLQPSTTR